MASSIPKPSGWLGGVLGSTEASPRDYEPQKMNSALLYVNLDANNYLTLSLASFTLPKVQTGETMIAYLNEVRKYAGHTMYDNISATFVDYVDRRVAKLLWNWKLTVHNPWTGTKGFKSQYAKAGWIEMYPPGHVLGVVGGVVSTINNAVGRALGNSPAVVAKYKLVNMWPSAMDPGDIDMGSDEAVRISVQFSIDKALPWEGLL